MSRGQQPGDRQPERTTLPLETTAPAGAEKTGGQDFILTTVLQVEQHVGAVNVRIDGIQRKNDELLDNLRKITPQIEHVYGFAQHTAPHLASKADLEKLRTDLMTEIGSRPTTVMMLTISAIVLAVVALPFIPDWWARLQVMWSHVG